jgi:hypothetical protein
MFFFGMALVTVSLCLLSVTSWRDSKPRGSVFDAQIEEDDASLSAPILEVRHSRAIARADQRHSA